MAEDLVTVATFSTLPEAEAARLHLETEGVSVVLVDAEIVSMDWLLGNAVGNVKLQVPDSMVDQAVRLLDEVAEERAKRREMEGDDDWESPDDELCLSCGAQMPEDENRCEACGWSWADGRE